MIHCSWDLVSWQRAQELHWLRVPERIDFCLAVLVYRCINGTAPCYLASELQRVADIESCGLLWSSSTVLLHIPRSLHKTIGTSPLPLRESGTCYHERSRHCHHCRLWSVRWRRNCFADHTTTHTSRNGSTDTSLIRDIYCGSEVLFETCVAMKLVDD